MATIDTKGFQGYYKTLVHYSSVLPYPPFIILTQDFAHKRMHIVMPNVF